MRMLRWMCGVIKFDRNTNEIIKGTMKVGKISKKGWGIWLICYRHAMRMEEHWLIWKCKGVGRKDGVR